MLCDVIQFDPSNDSGHHQEINTSLPPSDPRIFREAELYFELFMITYTKTCVIAIIRRPCLPAAGAKNCNYKQKFVINIEIW